MKVKKKYNKEIVKLVEERLIQGKREYGGEINVHDGRDWNQEALEEILDCCVYVAAKVLEIKEKADSKINNSGDEVEYKY